MGLVASGLIICIWRTCSFRTGKLLSVNYIATFSVSPAWASPSLSLCGNMYSFLCSLFFCFLWPAFARGYHYLAHPPHVKLFFIDSRISNLRFQKYFDAKILWQIICYLQTGMFNIAGISNMQMLQESKIKLTPFSWVKTNKSRFTNLVINVSDIVRVKCPKLAHIRQFVQNVPHSVISSIM